jgi:hypothetical protein
VVVNRSTTREVRTYSGVVHAVMPRPASDTTAATTSSLGPLGPGFVGPLDENSVDGLFPKCSQIAGWHQATQPGKS